MKKPSDVFDRDQEWTDLSRLGSREHGFSLGLVYGRRRQGKSFLLRRLAVAQHGFYHQALEEQRTQSLERFGDAVAMERGLRRGQVRFSDWGDAFRSVLTPPPGTRRGARRVVVVDELPYLLSHSPELPSLLQSLIDERQDARTEAPASLILCGSALSVMSELLSGSRALRGRARLELVLAPFDYRQARAFWGVRDPNLALVLHAVVGGTPGYRDLIGAAPSTMKAFPDWLARTLLNPAHALFREAEYILAEDPRLTERALYHSVLDAISRGERSPVRIAGRVGRSEGALRHPLRLLSEAGFVIRAEDVLKERRPVIHVADPIVRFHHVVMRPTISLLEDRRPIDAWREQEHSFSAQILGPHFEDLAREWTRRFASPETLGGHVGTVGSTVVADASEQASLQIDVLALATPGKGAVERPRALLIGEAKSSGRVIGTADLARLERARGLIEASGRARTSRARLALFGRAGFDRELMASAKSRDDVILVDLERLYEGS